MNFSYPSFINKKFHSDTHLIINQKFGPLEISGGYTDVIILSRMVKLGKTPINEA